MTPGYTPIQIIICQNQHRNWLSFKKTASRSLSNNLLGTDPSNSSNRRGCCGGAAVVGLPESWVFEN
ncbi:hypothetical protein HanIR_Chr15g0731831 [Helianthus annuus]|nr:hypothetical protein HanIR_Chr15g0731831 [Helianthus annuus]